MTRFIRKPELREITGLSYTSIWRLEKRGEFPKRIQLPVKGVAWRMDEIEEWIATQPRYADTNTTDANG
ncbi:MAG: AlpA family transcriptional regulator [Bacteroidales bacterium]|nr:AlpA family transcriptional regulator [Candidatus Latescibacterota bacterium]